MLRRAGAALRDAHDLPTALEGLAVALEARGGMVVRHVAGAVVSDAAWMCGQRWQRRSIVLEGLSPDAIDLLGDAALIQRAAMALRMRADDGWRTGRAPGERFMVALLDPRYAMSAATLDSLATGLGLLVARDVTMAAARMNALLQERARIASEIHQGACQEIATLNLQLQVLGEVLHRDPSSAGSLLKEIERSAQICADNLRSAIVHLAPVTPDGSWLDGELPRFITDFCAMWNMTVDLEVLGANRDVDTDALGLVFAFVQEGLTNMRKHARSKRGVVRILFGERTLRAEVAGDIDASAPPDADPMVAPFGHGLSLMRGRARLLGGDIQFSHGARCTRLAMEIPA